MKNEIDFGELKTIYDADSLGQDYEGVKDLSTATQKCPEFLFHEITTSVKFLDKSHNMVNISVSEFNEFVDMARNGKICKINPILRGNKEYVVGNVKFVKSDSSDRVMVEGINGESANMSIKHFNKFIDAAIDGNMGKVRGNKIKG